MKKTTAYLDDQVFWILFLGDLFFSIYKKKLHKKKIAFVIFLHDNFF